MPTETIEQPAPGTDLVAAFRAAAPTVRERKFWITLGIAFLAHSMLLLSLVRSAPRQIGDENAPPEAVAVSFVTEAELMDSTTGRDGAPPTPELQPPGAPPTPQQPPTPEAQPVQPAPPPPKAQPAEKAPPPPPQEKAAAAELDPPDPKPETQAPEAPPPADAPPDPAAPPTPKEDAKARAEAKTPTKEEARETPKTKPPENTREDSKETAETSLDLAKEMPDLLQLPDATSTSKSEQPARKQQKQAMRQPDMSMSPGQQMTTPSYNGRSAGVERPAGVTRSGANDDFARGVIRALRATMPQMSVVGRVRVRIILNDSGNIASVVMLDGSGNTDLNRAVVFSTKQASFPFPPPGANDADKTFTITYIYE